MVLYQKTFNIGLNKWDALGVEVDNFYDDPVQNKIQQPLGRPASSYRFDIMDIQEWLEQPIIVDTEKDVYKVKDLLFDSANSWGAHSDESVPFFLNRVKRIEVLSDEFLLNIIKNVTEVTIESGKFVLNKIERK